MNSTMRSARSSVVTEPDSVGPRWVHASRVARTIVACGVVVGLAVLYSCALTDPDRSRTFIVRVDGVVAPPAMAGNDTLIVWFYGNVGSDGCSRVEYVQKYLTRAQLEVTFHGKYDGRPGVVCTFQPVALHYPEVVVPPLSSPFTIIVHQPDGALLRRVVVVQ